MGPNSDGSLTDAGLLPAHDQVRVVLRHGSGTVVGGIEELLDNAAAPQHVPTRWSDPERRIG